MTPAEEDELLNRLLDSLGLVRKLVPKCGACLFRAVAEHLYGSQGERDCVGCRVFRRVRA